MANRCILIDVDHTLVKGGTEDFYPGVKERLKKLAEQGDIWLFTARPLGPKTKKLIDEMGVPVHGYIQKPVAHEYAIIDDKVTFVAQEVPQAITTTLDTEGVKRLYDDS